MKTQALFLSLGLVTGAMGAIDASSIVELGERTLKGLSTQTLMTMNINHEAYHRELKLRSWTIGNEKSLVVILAPAKETGVASLRVENQMWNYFPKTDQTMRVPTSVMLQSWMGSDFTNDNLMKLSSLSKDYTHRWVRTEKLGKDKVHLIECLPKPNAPVVWGKINYWAKVSDNLPVKEDYYDEKGKRVRTLTLSSHKKMDDRVIPTRLTIKNVDSPNDETTVTYEKIIFDRKIGAHWFERERVRNSSQSSLNLQLGWATERLSQDTP